MENESPPIADHPIWENETVLDLQDEMKDEPDKWKALQEKIYTLTAVDRRVFQNNHNTIRPADDERSLQNIKAYGGDDAYKETMSELVNEFDASIAKRVNLAFENTVPPKK